MARKKKFELNDNNLAIAYYRFSSHSQNEASIDQQRELAHAWADAHGFKIVKEYEDAAISGTTENRPGFQQMLSEVAKIRPRVLIMWKTDRLGRDKYVLAMAKRTIRDAGCEIRLLAENIPTDGPEGVLIEGLMDAMAEYYSRQLSQNIQRGMDYNAQHALYNGHKLFGYGVDKSTKRYIVDPDTAPFVQRMFAEYAEGKAMQTICDELNAQGLRTTRGAKFGVKTMNKMLQNRAYIGEYRHGDIVVEGGMPVLVDEETFEKVQRKFAENKRKGSQRARGMDENDAPRYWLTGKVYCGKCGNTLQGVSGTSGTGRTYYYYYCSAQRRKQCTLKKVRKEKLEDAVTMILRSILHDSENLMSLAVDAAAYYEKNYRDTGYLDGLEAKRREVEKSLANLVKVIESGLISETVTERLVQLEEQKRALNEAIEAENIRAALCEDEHTIKAYFEKFLHADFDNPETRDQVLEYFVDKIYLTDDGLVVTSWYSEDRTEITWDMLCGEDGNPFVKGEAVKFDCFPFGSTNNAGLPIWQNLRSGGFSFSCIPFIEHLFANAGSIIGTAAFAFRGLKRCGTIFWRCLKVLAKMRVEAQVGSATRIVSCQNRAPMHNGRMEKRKEFNETLAQLRSDRGMTQQQLAERLHVSRTAVSKWETGGGYPNLDSLKDIAVLFDVSIDELLSGSEVLGAAEQENRTASDSRIAAAFAALDIAVLALVFLPLYGIPEPGFIRAAPLPEYYAALGEPVVLTYFVPLVLLPLAGTAEAVTRAFGASPRTAKAVRTISFGVHVFAVLLFAAARQPYATAILFALLVAKTAIAMRALKRRER